MTRRLAWLAALPAAALLLGACSDPPSHGYVWSINYDPPSSYYVPGHWYSDCYGTSSNRRCYQEYSPGYDVYVPPEWQLDLCKKPGQPAQGNPCGWRDVDEATYHSVRLGQFWPPTESATPQ